MCWLFSLCGIYNKTIIHLSIGQSHRHLTQLLVRNNRKVSCKKKKKYLTFFFGGGDFQTDLFWPEKLHSVLFLLICALFLRHNRCKKLSFPSGIFWRSFVQWKAKESFCFTRLAWSCTKWKSAKKAPFWQKCSIVNKDCQQPYWFLLLQFLSQNIYICSLSPISILIELPKLI